MLVPYRVLLPNWVFSNNRVIESHLKQYMQRYPHYSVIRVEGMYAICKSNHL